MHSDLIEENCHLRVCPSHLPHKIKFPARLNIGLDPLTMMDWYYMDNEDSLYLSGCQSIKQWHAYCN